MSVGAVMTAENTSRSACFAVGVFGSAVGVTRRKLSNTSRGISSDSSDTLSRYVAMFSRGRKPQRAVKVVRASAISGLWFGSAKPKHRYPSQCGGGCGLTFVDIWLLDMQLLCCRLVRVTLYAERLLNGQYLEEKWEIAIFRAKFLRDPFAN